MNIINFREKMTVKINLILEYYEFKHSLIDGENDDGGD